MSAPGTIGVPTSGPLYDWYTLHQSDGLGAKLADWLNYWNSDTSRNPSDRAGGYDTDTAAQSRVLAQFLPTIGQNAAGTPPPTSGTGGSGGSGGSGFGGDTGPFATGGLLDPWGGTFTKPPESDYTLPPVPEFNAPDYLSPDPFKYEDFKAPAPFVAPTAADALNDPGYQFRAQQGLGAMENSAAAKGLLRTGGTLKDLAKFSQDYASTEYGNVYARKAGEWDRGFNADLTSYGTNEKKAADTWAMNTSEGLNAYDKRYQAALAEFSPKMTEYQTQAANVQRKGELAYSNAWQEYLQRYKIWEDQRTFVRDTLADQQRIGIAANS